MDMAASSSYSAEQRSNGSSSNTVDANEGQNKEKEKEEPTTTNTVPFLKLFTFADSTDKLLMIVGTIAAIGNGLGLPLMTIIFGEMTDSFGQTQNIHDVVRAVSKVNSYPPFFSFFTFHCKN